MYYKQLLLVALLLFFPVKNIAQSEPKEEFRGVWIVTAFNIDWPSSPYLTSEQQKQEFINLLDIHKSYGINAVLVQVKPSGEVFYPSQYEPWSHWLTGKQGKAPEPYYDPLEFMIEECRKRNMEFHAWINPFRYVSNIARVKPVPGHITREHPEWFIDYGDEIVKKYLNPGIPEARAYVIKVIMEIVHKYDVDGIHFDDYFYPFKRNGIEFPDLDTYRMYNPDNLSRDDWRRENINRFIHDLSDSINAAKPAVKFGIAPVGIWRNKYQDPEGSDTRGLSAYDQLYADILLWLREGWIDYVAPQIYWNIGDANADYHDLVDWWSRHTYGKHLYIGQAVHRVNTTRSWQNPSEIPDQIRINREYPEVKGSIFYSSRNMLTNVNGLNDSLRNHLFLAYADPPKMPWKQNEQEIIIAENPDTIPVKHYKLRHVPIPPTPENLKASKVRKEILLTWEIDPNKKRFLADTNKLYRVYRFRGKYSANISDDYLIAETSKPRIMLYKRGKLFGKKYTYVVTAVSNGKESFPSEGIVLKMKIKN